MKRTNCEFEERVVRDLSDRTLKKEVLSHLERCSDCRQVADIVQGIQARIADVPPPSGLSDDAERLWHASRCLKASSAGSQAQWWYVVRWITLAAPPLITLVVFYKDFASMEIPAKATQLLDSFVGGAVNHLSTGAAAACAGGLLALTALALVRLALSD